MELSRFGGTYRFKQEAMPKEGALYSPAELQGVWIQTGTEIQETEWDNSEFNLAGDLTDHRDGTMTVKMGKFTTEEMLLMEVLA